MLYSQTTIDRAINMIKENVKKPDTYLNNPNVVKTLCTLEISQEKNEIFCAIFLDNQHGIICFEKLFFGTINASSVHPRIVVQRALHHNAAAVIISHNHPSGICEPSLSDMDITTTLKDILKVVDVRLLDHIIVAGTETYSFAEKGKL